MQALRKVWDLWDRPEPAAEPPPKPLSQSPARNRSRKRRRKRDRIVHLYAKPPTGPQIHARALLEFIQGMMAYAGAYVPQREIDKYYRESLCLRRGWEPYGWVAIARQFGKLADKKTVRETGERFVAYKIPCTAVASASPPPGSRVRASMS